jgi:hypothetical protein
VEKEPSENKSETKAAATVFKYVGDGTYLQGVPARDLSKDDVDQLSDDQKADVAKSGLYKKGGTK